MVMVRMVHIVLVIMCSIDLQAMHVSEIGWGGGVVARITFRDFLEYWSYISNFPIVRYLADIT